MTVISPRARLPGYASRTTSSASPTGPTGGLCGPFRGDGCTTPASKWSICGRQRHRGRAIRRCRHALSARAERSPPRRRRCAGPVARDRFPRLPWQLSSSVRVSPRRVVHRPGQSRPTGSSLVGVAPSNSRPDHDRCFGLPHERSTRLVDLAKRLLDCRKPCNEALARVARLPGFLKLAERLRFRAPELLEHHS